MITPEEVLESYERRQREEFPSEVNAMIQIQEQWLTRYWTPNENQNIKNTHKNKKFMQIVADHFRKLGFKAYVQSYAYEWSIVFSIPIWRKWWKKEPTNVNTLLIGSSKE